MKYMLSIILMSVTSCMGKESGSFPAVFYDKSLDDSLVAYVNQVNNIENISSDAVITICLSYNDWGNDTTLTFNVSNTPMEFILVNDVEDSSRHLMVFDKGYAVIENRKCWVKYIEKDCFDDIVDEKILLNDVAYEDVFSSGVPPCVFRRQIYREYVLKRGKIYHSR